MVKEEFTKNQNGFSTLEILISLFIFSIVMSSLFLISLGSQSAIEKSKIYQELLAVSQFHLEDIKIDAINSYESVSSGIEVEDGIEASISVSHFYDYTKKIKINSSIVSNQDIRPVELSVMISNWSESIGASTCLRKFRDMEFSVGETLYLSNEKGTDIDVVRGKAYITLATTTDNFLVVGVSEDADPVLISKTTTSYPLSALHVAGRYVFLAARSSVKQAQIIDVFNPENPAIIGDLELPENDNFGISIFYEPQSKKIFLGTSHKENGGPEFHYLDVSNSMVPKLLNSWDIGNQVNDIVIHDNFAFLASVNSYPLRVIDLDDFNSEPIKIFVASPGNDGFSGSNISLLNNFLILGRSVLNRNPDYHELIVFKIENPKNPEIIDSFQFGETTRGVIGRENLLAVVTTWGSQRELQFFQPDEFYKIGLPQSLPVSGKPAAIDCEENNLYILTEKPSELIILKNK